MKKIIAADTTRNNSILLDCNKETELGKITRLATNKDHPLRVVRNSYGRYCIIPEKFLLMEIGGIWYRVLGEHRITTKNEDGTIKKVEFSIEVCESKIDENSLIEKKIIEVPTASKKMVELPVELSRNGLTCMWESGGGYTNTGYATLIANDEYGKKKPIFIKKSGERACNEQALIVVRPGHVICKTHHHQGQHTTTIYRIVEIYQEEGVYKARCEITNSFEDGTWSCLPSKELMDMARAAWEKAESYHSRTPVWVKTA